MDQAALDYLIDLLGPDHVSVTEADRDAHSQDESFHPPHRADVVVWPENAEQISRLLKYASENRIPVTPWGGGSSLEGNPIPMREGILLALYNMNQIIEIREADRQVVVQPGIICDQLNEALSRYGLFFPPTPGSSDVASIGGMVANNSSGMHAVKYGATKDYVLALEIVLADGRIIRMGRPVIKTTSGYDLIRLFVGSEGTLCVVTEITLKLALVPERVAAVATFPTMDSAAQAIYEINRYGPIPAALELMDPEIIRLVNAWKGLELEEVPTLVMEFHGTPNGIAQELALIGETCEFCEASSYQTGINPGERDRLWEGRKAAHDACKYLNPGCSSEIGDLVVPISRYAEAVAQAHQLAAELGLRIATFGHAGDGNMHVEMLAQEDDPSERARAEEFNIRLVEWALSVGGTSTGEHGVGIGKRRFMKQEHGASLDVMRSIKELFDPQGILNPGKVFPDGQYA
jgi:D-lactate dehydrogenase (cytochrome)